MRTSNRIEENSYSLITALLDKLYPEYRFFYYYFNFQVEAGLPPRNIATYVNRKQQTAAMQTKKSLSGGLNFANVVESVGRVGGWVESQPGQRRAKRWSDAQMSSAEPEFPNR